MTSWAGVLIIIFVAAMAFGPLMWFRSTPAQRRLVAVRNRAAQLGLRVRMLSGKDLELPGIEADELIAGYCLTVEPTEKAEGKAPLEAKSWRLIKERISHEAHFDGFWNWQRGRVAELHWQPAIREALGLLPPDTLALDYHRGTLCVFWREKGGPETVERLAGTLRQLLEKGVAESHTTAGSEGEV